MSETANELRQNQIDALVESILPEFYEDSKKIEAIISFNADLINAWNYDRILKCKKEKFGQCEKHYTEFGIKVADLIDRRLQEQAETEAEWRLNL